MIGPTKSNLTKNILFNVATLVGERKRGEGQMMDEKRITADATKAYMFTVKTSAVNKPRNGGYKLTHKPSAYGIAIKWLIFIKGMTYAKFAERYNGTTGQNINHLINRCSKERYFEEDIAKICDVLGVTFEYFTELCAKIEEKMEA